MSNPGGNIPALPVQFKPLNHCLKIAAEHDVRDPVVSYWSRFYAVQEGLRIDKTSPEAKKFLFALMDWLENRKKELRDNEAITNEAVAEAHIENYILRIFNWADSQDRAGVFNKNVVKTFYTAGILIDVLTNFGDLSEDFQSTRKYAKWKAAYINNCLKNGETPIPGPPGETDEDETEDQEGNSPNTSSNSQAPAAGFNLPNTSPSFGQVYQPQISPVSNPIPVSIPSSSSTTAGTSQFLFDSVSETGKGPVPLSVSDMAKAQKYCKWAGSALTFDDVPTAITNLEKALRLLQTGRDE